MNESSAAGPDRRIGILTTDTGLVIKSWDTALERMTGIPAERARGQRIDELVPDLASRVPHALLREPLVSGTVQVLAPAIHRFLIPCTPLEPSQEFDLMQQRVVVGALRDDEHVVGLVVTIEDVTLRLERERRLARQLSEGAPAERVSAARDLAAVESVEFINELGPIRSALDDDDWQVRRSAVRALAVRRDQALVDAVITALREGHRDFSLLSSALQLLSLTGVDVTDALVGLLRNPDADLRIQVALALGTQHRPEALDALIEALDDQNANVRFHAIEALGRLAHPGAIDRLAAIAESGDFFLAFPAIEALVRINDPVVAPRLVALLSNDTLGGVAAEALGQLADEDAVVPLVQALDVPEAPTESIVDALVRIHQRYQAEFSGGGEIQDLVQRTVSKSGIMRMLNAFSLASGGSLKPFVIVLGWLNDEAVPRTLARLLGSPDVRHEVIEAFVRFGASGVPLLIDQLAADDIDMNRSAIVALGRVGDRRATLALAALLLDDDSRGLWAVAAGALARLGDPAAFDALCSRLADRDAVVRQAAIGALNSIGHPEMEPRICAMLEDPRPLARESAVRIAGYFGYSGCVDTVFARCRDADESVRAAALEHLPYFDDPRALEALSDALMTDVPRARAAAAQALGSLMSPHAITLLLRAVADPDPWVRYFTAGGLGRQGVATALPVLERTAHTDPATHVAVSAIEAIGAIGGVGTIVSGEVAAILAPLTETPGERGYAAVRVLGRVRSSRAVDILLGALRSNDPMRRAVAIEALGNQDDGRVMEMLEWTASADADPAVTRAALTGLGAIANRNTTLGPAAVRALAACLGDVSRRAAAWEVLARLGPSGISSLVDLLETSDPPARRDIVEALSRLAHPAASAGLQRALSDGDPTVRRAAIGALGRLGTSGVSRRLSILAEHDPSEAVRDAATAALERFRSGQTAGSE